MSPLLDLVVVLLLVLGSLAVLIAAVGVVRMPDLFTRMQASSKAATLGAILALLASAVAFLDAAVAVRALLIALFLLGTAPVGAHAIARAGYVAGVRMSDPGAPDALEGRYQPQTHRLSGLGEPEAGDLDPP
jgi:multicomponent Na+:H+ antiporter subunit G